MKTDSKKDFQLEEYKMLRTTIARQFDARERNLLAMITTCGVALGLGLANQLPVVLLVATAIPAYFWLIHLSFQKGISKVGAYLIVFFEGKETGLGWETRLRAVRQKRNGRLGTRRESWLRKFLLPYPILIIGSFSAFCWKLNISNLVTLGHAAETALKFIVFLAVSATVLVIAYRTDKQYGEQVEAWKETFEELKGTEKL